MLVKGQKDQNMVSAQKDREKAIVIRDRRKPNQYTTDNIIAREWLPILRVGDAFFFYSVYLSMANKETESSWSSLRTLAQYLQCGVDLIIRSNKLLEICELIYIETGNQRTSNEYYILDPPTLTPELKERITERLDEIEAQQTSKNWQSWVRQVRKALERHRSLTSIWAERRAKRGGRPRTRRPQNSDREPQPGLSENGACDSQPLRMWDTTSAHVSHKLSVRESQAEQDKQTEKTKQDYSKETDDPLLLVRARCKHLGIAATILDIWLGQHAPQYILQQLDWLPFRNPRDAAAMLVSALQGDWERPVQYDKEQAEQIWAEWLAETGDNEDAELPPGDESSRDEGNTEDDLALLLGESALDAREVWGQVLEELRMQMTSATFDTWLRGSRVVCVREGEMIVRVRDGYAVDWLQARWLGPIRRTVAGVVGQALNVRFEAA
jgi:hypothetical protein